MLTDKETKEIVSTAVEDALKKIAAKNAPTTGEAAEVIDQPRGIKRIYHSSLDWLEARQTAIVRWLFIVGIWLFTTILNYWTGVFAIAQFFSGSIYGVHCCTTLMLLVFLYDVFAFPEWSLYETLADPQNAPYRIWVVIAMAFVFAICVYAGTGNQSVGAGRGLPAASAVQQRAGTWRAPAGQSAPAARATRQRADSISRHGNSAAAPSSRLSGQAPGAEGRRSGATERLE